MNARSLLLLLAATLAACGRDEPRAGNVGGAGGGGAGGGGGGEPAKASVVLADEGPFTDDPAGPAWEACGWVPEAEQGDVWRFDVRALRQDPTPWRTGSVWYDGVEARRVWVRMLGLPEDALGDVIAVQEPFRCQACQPRIPEAEVVRGLQAKGFVEVALAEGARAFRWPDAEQAHLAIVDGRLILGGGEETIRRILDVRRGRTKSMQAAPGVRAACAAAPKGLPAQVQAGGGLKRRRPSDPPPPLALVSVTTADARVKEVHAFACASEQACEETRRLFERMVPLRPDARPDDVYMVGVHGATLRFTIDGARAQNVSRMRRAALTDLETIASALATFRERRGALPSASEGLAALRSEPETLDALLGTVPNDPWGSAFVYQPGHPKRPDGYVLRSLGPDGEIDTEDDVLPDAKDR